MIKKFNSKLKFFLFLIFLFIPTIIFVDVEVQANSIDTALEPINKSIEILFNIVDKLISISFALAFLVFFYGIYKYIKEDKKEAVSNTIVPSLIGLFVLTSIWGLIAFIRGIILPNDIMDATNFKIPSYKS